MHKILCTAGHYLSAVASTGRNRCPSFADGTQSIHQPLKDSLLRVVVALAGADSAGMTPDLRGEKDKTQTGRR